MRLYRRDPSLIRLLGIYSLRDFAAPLGISRSAVSHWYSVPPRHVPLLANHFGIHPSDLRPDLWSPPPPRLLAPAA